jgi:hypothetical protein
MLRVPSDILRVIFLKLELDEIRQCIRVCKAFYQAMENNSFWFVILSRFEEKVSVSPVFNAKLQLKDKLESMPVSAIPFECIDINRVIIDEYKRFKYLPRFNDTKVRKEQLFLTISYPVKAREKSAGLFSVICGEFFMEIKRAKDTINDAKFCLMKTKLKEFKEKFGIDVCSFYNGEVSFTYDMYYRPRQKIQRRRDDDRDKYYCTITLCPVIKKGSDNSEYISWGREIINYLS